jgi:hypothetical protein
MSSDRNERFSDLELARALTRHLRGGAGARAEPHGKASKLVEPRPHYIRFDGQKLVPDAEALFGGRGPRARFGPDTWNALLDGALSAADAETAFLMDAQGLVVACRGGAPGRRGRGHRREALAHARSRRADGVVGGPHALGAGRALGLMAGGHPRQEQGRPGAHGVRARRAAARDRGARGHRGPLAGGLVRPSEAAVFEGPTRPPEGSLRWMAGSALRAHRRCVVSSSSTGVVRGPRGPRVWRRRAQERALAVLRRRRRGAGQPARDRARQGGPHPRSRWTQGL